MGEATLNEDIWFHGTGCQTAFMGNPGARSKVGLSAATKCRKHGRTLSRPQPLGASQPNISMPTVACGAPSPEAIRQVKADPQKPDVSLAPQRAYQGGSDV